MDYIASRGLLRIGLLASPTTIVSGLYSNPLEALSMEILKPSATEQVAIETAIRSVIAGDTATARFIVLANVSAMIQAGAQAVLLGCTELSIAGKDLPYTIDPLTLITEHLLSRQAE